MTILSPTAQLSQANITLNDVRLLGGLIESVRNPEAEEALPASTLTGNHAGLRNLSQRLGRAGLGDQAMLFETCDTPALVDLAATAALGLFASLPNEVGAAAVEALTRGAQTVRPAGPAPDQSVCMNLDRIRLLVQSREAAGIAAAAVRDGDVSKRPFFSVTPPGAGFGDWFGKQMYSSDAKGLTKYPAKALEEWGRYVDALSEHAEVFVIPYASHRDSSLWRIVYTANGPQILDVDGELHAILPNLSHLGRQGEHRWFQDYALQLGIHPDRIHQSPVFQEGQADFARPIPRKGKKPLLFLGYGIRTPTTEPYKKMRAVTVGGRKVDLLKDYDVEMIRMNPNSYAFHQDTWLNVVRNRDGKLFCMYAPGWIHTNDRGRFAGILKANKVKPILLSEQDAKGYAANANEVNGTIFLVRGGALEVSTALRKKLASSGFDVLELEFDELFGKAGGGTRCMVNEVRGIDPDRHREFYARLEHFRYVPGSWRRLTGFYPASYEPKDASGRKRFVP